MGIGGMQCNVSHDVVLPRDVDCCQPACMVTLEHVCVSVSGLWLRLGYCNA
jgi:hypothetical protein